MNSYCHFSNTNPYQYVFIVPILGLSHDSLQKQEIIPSFVAKQNSVLIENTLTKTNSQKDKIT